MNELKTLKELPRIGINVPDFNKNPHKDLVLKYHVIIEDLREEAINWMKNLNIKIIDDDHYWDDENNRFCNHCRSGIYECNCRIQDRSKMNWIKDFFNITAKDLELSYNKYDRCGRKSDKEIEKIIEDFENPYPKDIFVWDNKEKLDFNRGRFNEFTYSIVENMRKNLLKEIKEVKNGKEKRTQL